MSYLFTISAHCVVNIITMYPVDGTKSSLGANAKEHNDIDS